MTTIKRTTERSYTYKGHVIERCESAYAGREGSGHPGKWIVRSYHFATGMRIFDQQCPHYQTLAQAREAVTQDIADAAYLRTVQ